MKKITCSLIIILKSCSSLIYSPKKFHFFYLLINLWFNKYNMIIKKSLLGIFFWYEYQSCSEEGKKTATCCQKKPD